MDSQLGAPVGERLPDHVRTELTDVDRLRAVWAEHRRHQDPKERATARRALAHDRVLGWGGGPELTELLLAEPAGAEPLSTEGSIAELATRVADLSFTAWGLAPTPLPAEHLRTLAEAVRLPVHPVVRAAHAYAECVRLSEVPGHGLTEPLVDAPRNGTVRRPPPVLAWVLASRVLQRAGHPPLPLDPRTPPPEPPVDPGIDRHVAELVPHFARLVTEALRWEIGWRSGTDPLPATPVSPLAAVTRRRVLDHVRSRSASVALILRALDPGARTVVTSGEGHHDQASATSRPGLLTPGAAHWWTRLDLLMEEASLTLHVVVQNVGSPPSGVLAITADARLTTPTGAREALEMSGSDSVTVMPSDCVDDRWPQVRDLVDEAVSRAMNELTRV